MKKLVSSTLFSILLLFIFGLVSYGEQPVFYFIYFFAQLGFSNFVIFGIFYFSAQTSSLPLPMSVPGWPGGLPPMGYDRINLLCVPCSFGY